MRAAQSRSGAPQRRVLHVMRMKGVAGSEKHLVELARELRELGWRSDALIPTPDPGPLAGYAAQLAAAGGGEVRLWRMRRDLDPRLVEHLRRALRGGDHAVVHTHLVHADWHAALASVGSRGAALVSSKHNHDPFRTGRAYQLVERWAARRAARTIAISRSLAEFTQRYSGVACDTVRYGLAMPENHGGRLPRSAPPTILAVGRLEPQKGFDVLLDALALLPGVRLRLAGEGSRRGELEKQARDLGIRERVEFLGWRSDVGGLMREAHVLVHPARWEGFGLVLLEAMGHELPIVAARVGAIPEVVDDGRTGRLVDPEDATGLARAVRELMEDPAQADRLAAAGRERARTYFSPRRMAEETVGVYEEASSRAAYSHAHRPGGPARRASATASLRAGRSEPPS